MNQNKLNILITGAKGFIGKNLVEYLTKIHRNKYSLFYPYHSELELLDATGVSQFIKNNNINIIVHCANIGGSRKTAYDKDRTDVVLKNLRMFFNLERCLGKGKRMIFLGTGAEYGRKYYKPKMNEDYFGKHVPEDTYGFSKYVCSKYIEGVDNIVNLRIFGAFGKYEDYEYKFISNTIVKNLFGLPIVINQNVNFAYVYVNDLAKIIEYFICHEPGHRFYNVTPHNVMDLRTIVDKIDMISKKTSKLVIRNEGLNTEYSGNNAKILNEIKGFEFTPIDDALEELYSWYEKHLHKIDRRIIEKDEYVDYCRKK